MGENAPSVASNELYARLRMASARVLRDVRSKPQVGTK
jgi:hypothetical protein